MLSFSGARRLPLIRQSEATECGLACLAMVASYYGHRIDLNTLRRRYPVSLNGVTLRALMQVAYHLKLVGRPLRFELEHLFQLRLPAILHWDLGHFVVLKSVKRSGVIVYDPAYGERSMSPAEASKHTTGVALELTPSEGFLRKDERASLPLSVFWSHLSGSGHALLQIFVLSVVLQLLLLAGPFYMQITIDEVIARGDVGLLVVLALGFGLLALIRVASSTIRSLVLLVLQNALHFQLGARLFRHLIRLPMSYFEKRHIGDILSRFTSLQPIRSLMTEGMIAAVLDGAMAILSLVIILIYSPLLAGVVIGAVVLYAVLRLTLYRTLWRRTEATIEAGAQESTTFIETVRAIQSLKLFNRESERESQWLNRFVDVANANIRLGRSKVAFGALSEIIFGLETILSVYIAANLALSNQLTVGMIFAFMAYKSQFTEKTVALIEKSLEFRMLGLHLERLSDIALTEQDRGHDLVLSYMRPIEGRIELRNVFFRYSEAEPFVLEDVNLTIEPGEFITIMGPSGGGKTTLIKVLLGLLQPTSGEVLIDGVPLQTLGARNYREQIAAVMQEDQLLSGSIADNICFFDPQFDQTRMIICAQIAGIDGEIMAMPMTYNSLVGDMGSSLSGGQKQRVLIARALYRDPRILFLDEGTAHLDSENERLINEGMRTLKITRVSVAHRSDITSGTDRIVYVSRRVQSIVDGTEVVGEHQELNMLTAPATTAEVEDDYWRHEYATVSKQVDVLKAERDALKHDIDRHSRGISSTLAELDTLKAKVESLEDERSKLRLAFNDERDTLNAKVGVLEDQRAELCLAFDRERDALEAKVEALEGKHAELRREFNRIRFLRNERMEDQPGEGDAFKAKFAESDAAPGEIHFVVAETALRQARAQFECLAGEFNELGDIVSQVMCEVGACRMDRALIAAAPETDHSPDNQIALSILAQPSFCQHWRS